MRRLIGVVALLLLLGAVLLVLRQPSRSGLEATDATATTAAAVAATDESIPPQEGTTTTSGSTDTTEQATTTQPIETAETAEPAEPIAVFAVTEIQFGESGFVSIQNVGSAPGPLGGHALCSQLQYFQIPDIELQPLGIVWVAFGDGSALTSGGIADAVFAMNGQLGTPERTDGELALYRASNFGNPDLMVTYVEWGSSGHARSDVAVEAGLWEAGAFLEIPVDAFGIQSVAPGRPATGLQDWTAGIGG